MSNLKSTKPDLFIEIKSLIEETKSKVAVTVNSSLTLLYWHIGKRINDDVLKNKRAEYWERDCLYTVKTIS